MANNLFNYFFKITSDAKSVTSDMGKLHASVVKVDTGAAHMDKSFMTAFNHMKNDIKTIKLDAILNQVDRVAGGLESLNQPGMDLSSNMYELSAMTGVAGDKLKEIEGYARATGKEFGLGAAGGAESFKLVLGQLSPEIAKVPKALDGMGKNIAITSKLMGNDQVGAANLLTTAMNQYGVSLDDPMQAQAEMAKMMNIMAAAAAEGSAELPQQQAALENSGMAAKGARVSFEETAAAIQVLDKAGKKGSEGGIALRNTLAKLSEGRFLPKDVQKELAAAGVNINTLGDKSLTMADRMKPLRKIMGDSALITKMFGSENSNAAMALINGIEEQERLTAAVSGTNAAYEQAAIIMESPLEKNKRLQAQVDDFKITLFNATGGLLGYASVAATTARDVGNLIPLFSGAATMLTTLSIATKRQALWTTITTTATGAWATVQAILNATMWGCPVLIIAAGVVVLVGAIMAAWNKFEGFRRVIMGTWETMKFFGSVIKDFVIDRIKGILSGLTGLGKTLMLFFSGEWKQAWETGKKAVIDLSGVEAGQKAFNKLKNGTVAAYKTGADKGSASFKADQEAAKKATEGIAEPTLAGVPNAGGAGKGGKAAGTDDNTKTNKAIATGGTKHNYITINLGNLVETIHITGKDFKDSAQKLETQVTDAVARVLGMAVTAAD